MCKYLERRGKARGIVKRNNLSREKAGIGAPVYMGVESISETCFPLHGWEGEKQRNGQSALGLLLPTNSIQAVISEVGLRNRWEQRGRKAA